MSVHSGAGRSRTGRRARRRSARSGRSGSSSKSNSTRRSKSRGPTSSTTSPVSSRSSRRGRVLERLTVVDAAARREPPRTVVRAGPGRSRGRAARGRRDRSRARAPRARVVGVTPGRTRTVSQVASTAATIVGIASRTAPASLATHAASEVSTPPRARTCARSRELAGEPTGGILLDLVGPEPVAGLHAVEVRVEVRAREVAGRRGHLVEEIGAEHRMVDHEPLRRRVRTARAARRRAGAPRPAFPARADRPARSTGTRAPQRSRTRTPAASSSPSDRCNGTVRARRRAARYHVLQPRTAARRGSFATAAACRRAVTNSPSTSRRCANPAAS